MHNKRLAVLMGWGIVSIKRFLHELFALLMSAFFVAKIAHDLSVDLGII